MKIKTWTLCLGLALCFTAMVEVGRRYSEAKQAIKAEMKLRGCTTVGYVGSNPQAVYQCPGSDSLTTLADYQSILMEQN